MNDMESEQVCIVLQPVVWSEYQYYIYTIDLAKHDSTNILPPIRISRDWPVWMAFTVKGGTLYMFGGHQCDDRGWETRSFSLELPPRDLSSPQKEVREISKMNFPKAHPQAVWIKDRICVFSTHFAPGGNNFELYDPESNRWSTMPDPPLDFTKFPVRPESDDPWGESLVKLSHFYVDGNNLFMDTEVGSFLYQSKASVWVECEAGNLGLGYGKPHVWVKEGDFLFSPRGRIVDGKLEKYEGGELIPPRKNDQGMRMIRKDYGICGLPKKSEKLRLCVVKVGGFVLSDLYEDAVLSLDLVAIDDQAKHTILKSLIFNLDDTIETCTIRIDGIFPLSTPSWIEQAQTQMELIFL